MYVNTYIYICMHVDIPSNSTQTCMHIFTHFHVDVYTCTRMYICIHINVYVCKCIHVCIYIYTIYMYMDSILVWIQRVLYDAACMYIYIYMYMYMCINICIFMYV